MSKRPETIAIIPARGGSKGIPRKNIADLGGRPLIAYSILAALKAKSINRVIVSTDDEEIAEVARQWGAEVPFLRPKELATDTSGLGEVFSYTKSRLGNDNKKTIYVSLYPTSPFRTPDFIDEMMGILYKGYSSVTTVKEVSFDPCHTYIKRDNQLINLLGSDPVPAWKKYYRAYPLFQAYLSQKKEKHYYHVLTDKCMFIDIDTPLDLCWAEAVIKNKLFDFGF